jgi:hypothetical protein
MSGTSSLRRDGRSAAVCGAPSGIDPALITVAVTDLNSGVDFLQLAALQQFSNLLTADGPTILKTCGEDILYSFLHLAQHGLTPDTQRAALICLTLEIHIPGCNIEPICHPPFLHFLVESLGCGDPEVVNICLNLISTIFSESSDGREALIHLELFARFDSIPGLMECNIAEIVANAIQLADDPDESVANLAMILLQLLSSPNPDNVCHSLRGLSHLVSKEWICFDIEAIQRALPTLLSHENDDIVSASFLLLEQLPVTDGTFAAVMEALGRGSNCAINFLRRTVAVWNQNAPPELIGYLIGFIKSTSYDRGRIAAELIVPALNLADVDVLMDIMDTIGQFLSDPLAGKAVVKTIAHIVAVVTPCGEIGWLIEKISEHIEELEALLESPDEETVAVVQTLLNLIG